MTKQAYVQDRQTNKLLQQIPIKLNWPILIQDKNYLKLRQQQYYLTR